VTHPVIKALLAASALASIFWCVPAASADNPLLPPYSFAYEPQSVDERGIWLLADEEERVLRGSNFVLKDDGLNAYLRSVLCKAVGEDRCRNVRIYIMHIPQFNATMSPNGMMTVWSGLLLRVHSEAELAAVLGHEFGHFEKRHSLRSFQAGRTISDVMAWLTLFGPANTGLPTALIGTKYAFDRGQETEADLDGLRYLAASPYPSAAAARVWQRLMEEQDATAAGRKRKVPRSYSTGFFASHPSELARVAYLSTEAAKYSDDGDDGAEAYRAGVSKWMPQFLADQIKLNDFGGSEYVLSQLAAKGWTPELLFARAELYSQRGNPRDYQTAAQLYQEAIEKGFTQPEARRGLGLALLRTQQTDGGKDALRQYLQAKPDATDAAMIMSLVGN
jgi:Zn-dependent protease with chaperone function